MRQALFFVAFGLMGIFPVFSAELNGQKEFYDLPKKEALKKGQSLAAKDFEEGRYRILTYGMPVDPSRNSYAIALKKQGVLIYPIAGCIVSEGIIGGAEGYNKVMEALLLKKFKKDIFAEAREAGKSQQ